VQNIDDTSSQNVNDNAPVTSIDISKLICYKQLFAKDNVSSFKLENGVIINQQKNETKKLKTIYEEITSKLLSSDKVIHILETLIKDQEKENNKAYTC